MSTTSERSAKNMNLFYGLLLLFGSADCNFDIFGGNYDKIKSIFKTTQIINLLLKNHEQSEGMIEQLKSIFGSSEKTFVVFNFQGNEKGTEWSEQCVQFSEDHRHKTLYYERLYQKTHDLFPSSSHSDSINDNDDALENSPDEDNIDSQAPAWAKSLTPMLEQFTDGLDLWYTFRYSGYILFATRNMLQHFISCLVNRSGKFLVVIEDSQDNSNDTEEITKVLKNSWKSNGNLNVYVLNHRSVYHYSPFAFEDKDFGLLKQFEINDNMENFRNLNGYEFYVELFNSAYSVPNGTQTIHLNSFYGPDVSVAELIQKQMNVTSKKILIIVIWLNAP